MTPGTPVVARAGALRTPGIFIHGNPGTGIVTRQVATMPGCVIVEWDSGRVQQINTDWIKVKKRRLPNLQKSETQ